MTPTLGHRLPRATWRGKGPVVHATKASEGTRFCNVDSDDKGDDACRNRGMAEPGAADNEGVVGVRRGDQSRRGECS